MLGTALLCAVPAATPQQHHILNKWDIALNASKMHANKNAVGNVAHSGLCTLLVKLHSIQGTKDTLC